jgi:CRISPR/Cas system endoribonuclease Cas6 (RAMP superfamily)
MITNLLDVPHENNTVFSLVPWNAGCGWGVYIRTDAWAAIANKRVEARLFKQELEVRFSPLRRLRAPIVEKRGRQQIRVEAITPVCTRNSGGSTTYTAPTADNICNSMFNHTTARLGIVVPQGTICIELIHRDTTAESVTIGGKFGPMRGWVGTVDLEVNAVARWLLEVSGIIGLGGRTALGFGRVRVTGLDGAK